MRIVHTAVVKIGLEELINKTRMNNEVKYLFCSYGIAYFVISTIQFFSLQLRETFKSHLRQLSKSDP